MDSSSHARAYNLPAKLFHWGMALMILGLLGVGLYMTGMPKGPEKFELYGLHKSIGATVLLLAVLRILWRWRHVFPALPAHLAPWQRQAAQLAHAALYVLMVAMPLSGWLMSSAAGYPVSVFGLFTLPDLISPDTAAREVWGGVHEILAWLLIGTILAHAMAALVHHFYYKDDVLKRMGF